MKTFSIKTLGCKVNQYESQQIRELLEHHGLEQVATTCAPDLIVINTCCVTHVASSKSRQLARKAKKANPASLVVVSGCLPAGQTEELNGLDQDAIIIDKKEHLAEELTKLLARHAHVNNRAAISSRTPGEAKIKDKNILASSEAGVSGALDAPANTASEPECMDFATLKKYKGQTRAFLKIQDGCDGFCTYCIIPKIRNRLSSKPLDTVLKEARELVYAGHKEIVLTGIFLGAYGQDTVRRRHWNAGKSHLLAELVDAAAQIKGLERLRLSSLEPGDLTDELLDIINRHSNIAHHLHLPLQSGSGRILKRMCRQYSDAQFRQTIDLLNSRIDRPALTTDIIVGFPGETDEDFEQTVEMAQYARFAKIHVFSFSERKNTAAAKMDQKVRPEVIKARSEVLRNLDHELQADFRKQFGGERMSVIIENEKKQSGRTDKYFDVAVDSLDKHARGTLVTGALTMDAKQLIPAEN